MLPDVRDALDRIEQGGEAEGTVRMLELLSEARGYVRRSRLERAAAGVRERGAVPLDGRRGRSRA